MIKNFVPHETRSSNDKNTRIKDRVVNQGSYWKKPKKSKGIIVLAPEQMPINKKDEEPREKINPELLAKNKAKDRAKSK
ncbi:MAG: hypothetical protein R3B45_05250 [Bdellovibrionota bacterium]